MRTFFRRLFKTVLALIVIIIVVLAILIFAGVTIDLSKFRGAVETSIEAALTIVAESKTINAKSNLFIKTIKISFYLLFKDLPKSFN